MIDETFEELADGITKAHEALRRELSKIRTGRANPELLDSIRVEYYGSKTPLKQMASIGVPEARLLTVKPFDKTSTQAIERAIMQAGLGLNPQSDGELIRIPMPALTEERRRDLVKIAKKTQEDAKVSIRKARHEAKDMLESLKTEGEVGEDAVERALKKLEEVVQQGTAKVDEIFANKEKDILEI